MKSKYKIRDVIVIFIMIVLGVSFARNIPAFEFELGKKISIDVHGFLSQGYLQSNHNNFLADTEEGTFEFREYGINVSSDLTDQLHVGAQVFGRDLGDYGNNKIILDWGFVDYRFQDWLGIQVGRMKAVFGLYNETRDIDMVRTGIFLPESIYNDAWRETLTAVDGIGIYGTLSLKSLGSLSYQGQWGKVNIEPDGGFAKYINDTIRLDVRDIEIQKMFLAGVEWTPAPPIDGLRLRWSWNIGGFDEEGATSLDPFWQIQGVPPGLPLSYHADLNIHVVSAEYRWGNLVLAAETFLPAGYDHRLEISLPGLGTDTLFDESSDPAGYYASAAYSFTEWLELGILYSVFYRTADDKDGEQYEADTGYLYPRHNAWLKDTALTARFDIFENWVIKAEGHFMNGTDIMLKEDNPDGTREDWFLFGCKVTYSF
jgi:hypothetical protein